MEQKKEQLKFITNETESLYKNGGIKRISVVRIRDDKGEMDEWLVKKRLEQLNQSRHQFKNNGDYLLFDDNKNPYAVSTKKAIFYQAYGNVLVKNTEYEIEILDQDRCDQLEEEHESERSREYRSWPEML